MKTTDKHSSPCEMGMLTRIVNGVKRLHLNYNMITSLYMMEPMERTVVNCILILVMSLMMYSSWVYLPHYTLKLLIFSGILSREGFDSSILNDDDENSMNNAQL